MAGGSGENVSFRQISLNLLNPIKNHRYMSRVETEIHPLTGPQR